MLGLSSAKLKEHTNTTKSKAKLVIEIKHHRMIFFVCMKVIHR